MTFVGQVDAFGPYLCVEEDEVHLDEGERHASGRCDGHQNVAAVALRVELEVLRKLEPGVDHRPDAERCERESVEFHALSDKVAPYRRRRCASRTSRGGWASAGATGRCTSA